MATHAAQRLDDAVLGVYRDARITPHEFGGRDGTTAIANAVIERLQSRA